jgi:antitoxin component HigA of HigAB toxin-antitoxin module
MSNSFVKAETRYLLGLARHLIDARPNITSREMAYELGVCPRAGHNYRQQALAGYVPADPVDIVREYLSKYPRATHNDVAALLGLKRDAGRRYLQQALAAIEREGRPVTPPPKPIAPAQAYRVPVFRKLK